MIPVYFKPRLNHMGYVRFNRLLDRMDVWRIMLISGFATLLLGVFIYMASPNWVMSTSLADFIGIIVIFFLGGGMFSFFTIVQWRIWTIYKVLRKYKANTI